MAIEFHYQENGAIKTLVLSGYVERENPTNDYLLCDIRSINPTFSIPQSYYFMCLSVESIEKIRIDPNGQVYLCGSNVQALNIYCQVFTFISYAINSVYQIIN